jgi:hypothetical protein
MYNVGDSVYIYLYDLKMTLPSLKSLIYSRFGYITNIEKIYNQDGTSYPKYKVLTRTNTTFTIDENHGFKICSMTELEEIIESVKDCFTEKEYKDILDMTNTYKTRLK